MRWAVAVFALATGCASPALDYDRAHHPGCAVDVLEDEGDAVRVRVECPGAEPFERTYRSAR